MDPFQRGYKDDMYIYIYVCMSIRVDKWALGFRVL